MCSIVYYRRCFAWRYLCVKSIYEIACPRSAANIYISIVLQKKRLFVHQRILTVRVAPIAEVSYWTKQPTPYTHSQLLVYLDMVSNDCVLMLCWVRLMWCVA